MTETEGNYGTSDTNDTSERNDEESDIVMECKNCKARMNNKGQTLGGSPSCKHFYQPFTKIVYLSAAETLARDRFKRHQDETDEFITKFGNYKQKLEDNRSNCQTQLEQQIQELKKLLDNRENALMVQLNSSFEQKKEAIIKQYDALLEHRENCSNIENANHDVWSKDPQTKDRTKKKRQMQLINA